MNSRRLSQHSHQYSHTYHLSRTVQCGACGANVVKDQHFATRGFLCVCCWEQSTRSTAATQEAICQPLAWAHLDTSGYAECEACGKTFQPDNGYYEENEYAYCSDCCQW